MSVVCIKLVSVTISLVPTLSFCEDEGPVKPSKQSILA